MLRVGGLIVPVTRDRYPNYDLSAEGASVLLRLTATRPDSVKGARPAFATVAQLADIGRGIADREVRLSEIERAVSQWDAAFLRRKEAGKPTVVFSTRGEGPVPVLQTVWALRFDTTDERDAFYDWLCHRIERWQSWSELTSTFGAKDLTHKLLGVMVASLRDASGANLGGAEDHLLITQG